MLEDLNLTLNMATSGALANSSESMEDWRTHESERINPV
jgi:hypothetical protein